MQIINLKSHFFADDASFVLDGSQNYLKHLLISWIIIAIFLDSN